MADPHERIRWNVTDRVATITLDRPARRNALDARTIAELDAAVNAFAADDDARVLVLRGNGPDFCAGADLEQLERMSTTPDPLVNLDDATSLGRLFIHMRRTEKPIIAAVHGHAIAGGAGLATACDLIIAAEGARFGYPEVHLGFVPAMVTALLRRSLGEKRIFELITVGGRFSAQEALAIGLVTRVVADDQFDAEVNAFAREMASRSASAVRLCKRLLYGIDGMGFEDAIARAAEINVLARATPDCQSGLRRFLEKSRE